MQSPSLLLRLLLALVSIASVSLTIIAQSSPTTDKAALEILSFKVGNNYNALLDRQPSPFAADNPDLPQTEAEKLARRTAAATNNPNTTRRTTAAPIAPGDKNPNGKLRSTIRVIDLAEWVNLSLKNTSDKTIKLIVWDFAFPRYEDNKLVLRFDVSSKADIKPGSKKTLKQKLPPDAKKCQIVSAETVSMELVCGKGFNDPTHFKQPAVSIKKIEYNDGSVWEQK